MGIDLLDLDRKAFPKIVGTEFDCFLKGRFFQALQTKWQCKLEHEQQFTETAVAKGESQKPPVKSARNQASGDKARGRRVTPNSDKNKIPSMTFQRRTNRDRSGNQRWLF